MKSHLKKCTVCGTETEMLWQPLGPSDSPRDCFPVSGWQYRGFPAVAVCEAHIDAIKGGADVEFKYKEQTFTLEGDAVNEKK
jgi:hypothetical protein